jgi:hypothetical protein
MVSLVERDSNQALGRRFVLVSSVPVGDSRSTNETMVPGQSTLLQTSLGKRGTPGMPRICSPSLVERDSNQALGRRFVLVSSVPVGDGGVGNASHTLQKGNPRHAQDMFSIFREWKRIHKK